jgi:transposase
MRTKGSATELEARRRRAAEYFQARKPLPEIADLVGVHLSSVKRWKRAWRDGGVRALAAKPHPGPAAKLSPEQKEELIALLKAGPLAAGYRTDLWTCRRVAEVVRKKFRVSYHADHMGRILHDLGFTPQKPQRVAREQDAAAVERWRKKDWPRIKKRLAEEARALFLSTKRGFACSP